VAADPRIKTAYAEFIDEFEGLFADLRAALSDQDAKAIDDFAWRLGRALKRLKAAIDAS
jgi:hypothetical protein